MEGCDCLGAGAFHPIQVLFTILLPILIALFAVFHRIESLIVSIAQASIPWEPIHFLEEENHYADAEDHNTDTSEMATVIDTAAIEPTPRKCSTLLDSHLDDIKVPTLQPNAAKSMSDLAVSNQNKIKANKIQLLGPGELLDGCLDDLMIPALEPERKFAAVACELNTPDSPKSDRKRPLEIMPWDGKIRWAMNGCSVFDDQHEELEAYFYRPNVLSRQPVSDLWVFQYGLRYIPADGEENTHRTVRIEDLPSDATLDQILPTIPGEIYSASLFNTNPISGSNTAIVIFVWERDAANFANDSKEGLDLIFCLATVTPIHTPTYPMTSEMERLIVQEGYTRCLAVSNIRETLKEEICWVLRKSVHYHYVEDVEEGHVVGEVYIRFHSIKVAAAAYELLKAHPSFGRCTFKFLRKDQGAHLHK